MSLPGFTGDASIYRAGILEDASGDDTIVAQQARFRVGYLGTRYTSGPCRMVHRPRGRICYARRCFGVRRGRWRVVCQVRYYRTRSGRVIRRLGACRPRRC